MAAPHTPEERLSWSGAVAAHIATASPGHGRKALGHGRSCSAVLPRQIIELLRPQLAPRLQCVCLNGCETAELGFQIVSNLPTIRVICWSTVAEDAAARTFASGFYDAVGAFAANGDHIELELAFLAGVDRFPYPYP